MRHSKHALIILTVLAAVAFLVIMAPSSAEEPDRAAPATTSVTTSTIPSIDYQALGRYLDGLAFEQYLASLPPPVVEAPAPVVEQTPSASGSGACGGATNGADQYIGRETHGSVDPVNQANLTGSGAWGCYQIMPDTWASSCGDLGSLVGSDGATQAQCASRLPLSAWAGGG